jgi:dTMP kinase
LAFITFEGGEGAGKSTQETRLAEHLASLGHTVVRTREPGGTPAAEALRNIVLDPIYIGMDARAEALLFAAARGEHVARVIRPALDRGDVVLCDRYVDSSIAYQGFGRDLGAGVVRELSLWATGGLLPDLTIVLDIDPMIGLSRVSEPDRLEAEPMEYHQKVRQGFLDLAAERPNAYLVVDATGGVDDIAGLIRTRVDALLQTSS